MRAIIIFTWCGLVLSAAAAAQVKEDSKIRFHSINSLQLLHGSNGTAAGMQTVNGVSKKNWFAGVGAAIDFYQYRSIPVFADVRYEWAVKKLMPFVYTDAGVNLSWVEDKQSEGARQFEEGVYYDIGAGLNLFCKKQHALVLSLGFSRKVTKEQAQLYNWNVRRWEEMQNTYRLHRMVLKAGFRF